MMLSRCRSLLAAALLMAAPAVSPAQSLTTSRPFVGIGPVGDECQIQTCIEVSAERTGICAVQLLDNSGSMNTAGRFDAARAGIVQFVDSLRADKGDQIGVVTFNGPLLQFGVTPQSNLGPAVVTVQGDRLSQTFPNVKNTISGLSTASVSALTPLAAAIETGTGVLEECPAGSLRVLVISTDGLPNWDDDVQCGVTPLAPTTCTTAAVEAAETVKSIGVHVVTIGIDLDSTDPSDAFGISLLREVATSPEDANFFNTADGFGYADIYRHIASSVASPVGVQFLEPLPDACWNYVAGSTSGVVSTDPAIEPMEGVDLLLWDVGTVADGTTAGICYSMAYDESCGPMPSTLIVQPGGSAAWQLADGSLSSEVFGSQRLQNIVQCQIAIPVELTDFTATSSGSDVSLTWATASEQNNAGFGVERSTADGIFEQVSFVAGSGTSLNRKEYRYRDLGLRPGSYRYRLRQLDFDGTFAFSPTVAVSVELPSSHFMGPVHPNPFRNRASFDLSVARTQEVRIDLVDVVGRTVKTLSTEPVTAGSTHSIQLDASGLPGGTYVLRVVGENFSSSRLVAVIP